MFDKTIDRKPTIIDASGTVIKDLTVPIYKRTNQFQLNYTVKMTTLEQQMRADLISISEYGSDKYTEDILKLNGISNPFSMQTGQIIMIFDEKDVENLGNENEKSKMLEPYERLKNAIKVDNSQNPNGTGYENTPWSISGYRPNNIDTSLLTRTDITKHTSLLTRTDITKPHNKFEVDPITKKFINPNKLPELDLNTALDKITVGGKKKKLKEPNLNNDDKKQYHIKDGEIILGPDRDKTDGSEVILDRPNKSDPNNIEEQVTNTENLPEDIKDLIDDASDCDTGDNKCKDKYPEAFKEYLKNRDLVIDPDLKFEK